MTKATLPLSSDGGQSRSAKLKDMTGQRFGRLLVLGVSEKTKSGHAQWLCRCDCGHERSYFGKNLRRGMSRSCGCLARDSWGQSNVRHGHARVGRTSKEYRTWASMVQRCTDPSSTAYKDYGAHGVSVCERWREDFTNFLADMGPAPSSEHTIDRVDSAGNYEPANCRWADLQTQSRNRRSTVCLPWKGEDRSLSEISRMEGISTYMLSHGVRVLGLSVEEALMRRPRSRRHKATKIDGCAG